MKNRSITDQLYHSISFAHTDLLLISITFLKATEDTSLMERVRINSPERIGRRPHAIREPVVLWLGSHPLVTYPGGQDGVPSISFANAEGEKRFATAIQPSITMGRMPDNTLMFDEDLDMISRHHAQITLKDKVWHVEDLGSTNGTAVEKIPKCPPGETLLPKGEWLLIPDGEQQKITFSTVHRSNLTKDDELPFLTLLKFHGPEVIILDGPLFNERRSFTLPTHRPVQIGSSLDNDLIFPDQYFFAPQHATLINTGNGVLIRDNHATGVTQVKVAKR